MTGKELSKWAADELALLAIPGEFTPRFFEMDPQTDDCISGWNLKEGMIVILESTFGRIDPEKEDKTSYDLEHLSIQNRWCRIEQFLPDARNPEVFSFIGVYADGSKHSRSYNRQWAWYVKKSSI